MIYHPFHVEREEHFEEREDYHPLTKEELIDLLKEAYRFHQILVDSPDDRPREELYVYVRSIASIQIRLTQSIKGMRIPYEIEGDVAITQRYVDEMYVSWLQSNQPVSKEIVEALWKLLN